jgi:hypothetical protein
VCLFGEIVHLTDPLIASQLVPPLVVTEQGQTRLLGELVVGRIRVETRVASLMGVLGYGVSVCEGFVCSSIY